MDATGIAGICFTRQYPNPAEPLRGTFVAEQVAATAGAVDWRVVAPVAWPLRHRDAPVPLAAMRDGVHVAHPRYPVLPRRLLFTRVAASMARGARAAFYDALATLPDGRTVVHAHELYPSGLAAAMLADEHGLPLVVSIHGSDLYTNLADPRWRALIARCAHSAARVVCVSSGLADDLVTELSVDPGRVVVVHDTYDAARFSAIERAPHEPGAPVRLLTVGRLSAEKGVDVLLDALGLLRDRGVAIEATIVGGGPESAVLERRATALRLTETVRFTGPLGDARLVAELADADLYCQPSRREGFGVALVEALATGLPAVATDSGGPRDIVGADDGVLAAPGDPAALADAIASAAADLGRFDGAAIARRARERFGPEAVGERLVAVYRDALEEARR